MNRTEFIEKLDALSEEIRLHEPEDIRRVKQRNRPAKRISARCCSPFWIWRPPTPTCTA